MPMSPVRVSASGPPTPKLKHRPEEQTVETHEADRRLK